MKQGWEYKKLGEVCCPKNKIQRAARCFDSSDKILYIDISSIDNTIQKVTDITSVTFGDAPSRAQQKIEYGDIVVSTVRPNLKNIAIIDRYEPNIVASSGFCVLRNTECIERNYLFHYVTSDIFTQHLMKITTGANYPAVRDQDVRDSIIPLPPKSTQLAIVSELDKINELIRLKKEQLKDFDNLAQSIFYEMFGDPVENEMGWEVKKLGEFGELARGVSKHRPRNAPELLGGKMPLIQTGDVANSDFYIRKYSSTYSDLGVAQSKVWEAGTLCITIAATIGKCAILSFTACFPDSVVGYKPNKDTNTIYMFFIFKNMQKMLEEFAPGVAQKNINLKILSGLNIPLPPLPLQHLFAQRIEQIEHQKAEVQNAITDLETLLASRMQYWFE